MRPEEEVRREIKKLEKLEKQYENTILGDMAGIAKRRLIWVLGED